MVAKCWGSTQSSRVLPAFLSDLDDLVSSATAVRAASASCGAGAVPSPSLLDVDDACATMCVGAPVRETAVISQKKKVRKYGGSVRGSERKICVYLLIPGPHFRRIEREPAAAARALLGAGSQQPTAMAFKKGTVCLKRALRLYLQQVRQRKNHCLSVSLCVLVWS